MKDLDYVHTVTFLSVFSCKKVSFSSRVHTETDENDVLFTENVFSAKTFSDKRFHVETLKIQDGGLKSKYYILVSWKLTSFIGTINS